MNEETPQCVASKRKAKFGNKSIEDGKYDSGTRLTASGKEPSSEYMIEKSNLFRRQRPQTSTDFRKRHANASNAKNHHLIMERLKKQQKRPGSRNNAATNGITQLPNAAIEKQTSLLRSFQMANPDPHIMKNNSMLTGLLHKSNTNIALGNSGNS